MCVCVDRHEGGPGEGSVLINTHTHTHTHTHTGLGTAPVCLAEVGCDAPLTTAQQNDDTHTHKVCLEMCIYSSYSCFYVYVSFACVFVFKMMHNA